MSRSQQRKGRAGEIELSELLKGYGYNVRPGEPLNYGQEPDLIGLPGVHVECKRCEQLRLSDWMQQATRDADRFHDGAPVIFHRKNREGWLCTLRLDDFMRIYGGNYNE